MVQKALLMLLIPNTAVNCAILPRPTTRTLISALKIYIFTAVLELQTSLHVHVLHFSSAGDNPDMTDGRYYTWCDCNIFSGNVAGSSTVRQLDCGLE